MFKWFKKKDKNVINNADTNNNFSNDIQNEEIEIQPEAKVVKYPEIENKILYKMYDKELTFPEEFQKDKYYQTIQEELDNTGIGGKIDRIEFIYDLEDSAGDCVIPVGDKKISITVRIESLKLGLDPKWKTKEYTEDRNRQFREILAHELVHARDSLNIYSKYGHEEYKSIRTDSVTTLAWSILGEYTACREVSERFKTFNTNEHIEIEKDGRSVHDAIVHGNSSGRTPIYWLHNLNYAIATRSAHADVSEKESRFLETNKEEEKAFIAVMRSLFNKYYNLQPLNRVQYEELGIAMIAAFLTIVLKKNHNSVGHYIHFFR